MDWNGNPSMCLTYKDGKFKEETTVEYIRQFDNGYDEWSYIMDTCDKKDGDGNVIACLRRIVTPNGMFQPLNIEFSVTYFSIEHEEDAKRLLLDALIMQLESELDRLTTKNGTLLLDTLGKINSLRELDTLKNLRKNFGKTEAWCRINLYSYGKFEVTELNRSVENSLVVYSEGITDRGFVDGRMTAYCKKENLDQWKKELIKAMEDNCKENMKQLKEQYDIQVKSEQIVLGKLEYLSEKEFGKTEEKGKGKGKGKKK